MFTIQKYKQEILTLAALPLLFTALPPIVGFTGPIISLAFMSKLISKLNQTSTNRRMFFEQNSQDVNDITPSSKVYK